MPFSNAPSCGHAKTVTVYSTVTMVSRDIIDFVSQLISV